MPEASARWVLAACLTSQVAVAAVGQVPWWLAAAFVAVQLACTFAVPDVSRAVLVVAAPITALVALGGQSQGTPMLAGLLAGVQTGVVAAMRTPREQRTALLTSLGLMTLAAAKATDPVVGSPLLLGGAAALCALASLSGLRGRSVVVPVALTSLLGLAFFLVVPAPPAHGAHRAGHGSSSAAGSRGTVAYSSDQLDMSVRGDLPTTPVLSVDGSTPSLWRSEIYVKYTGSAWLRYAYRSYGSPPYLYLAPPTPRGREVEARPLVGSGGDVYAPGDIGLYQPSRPSSLHGTASGGLTATPPVPYRVQVEPYISSEDVIADGVGALSDGNPAWTQLPEEVPARVRALARDITQGAQGRIGSARAISSWLRGHVRYTTSSPVPRPGEDAVDRVLFKDRLGFCEQFAASEVVLLRTLGIPARLVTGLAYGQPDGAARIYTAKDLHAWVELWVPGLGWVTDDPTAGAEPAPAGSGVRSAVNTWLKSRPSAVGGRLPLALLLVAAAGGVAVLARRFNRPAGAPVPTGGATAVAAYQRWNARLGPRKRRAAETLRELGGRLGGPVAEALEVVEQELYAPVAPDPRGAVQVLDTS